jgi:hypothetical protein
MQLTTSEVIDRVLLYHLNVGQPTVTADTALRAQALYYAQEIATASNRLAPWPWRLSSGTVSITNGNTSAILPADFYHGGESMIVSVSGLYDAFLRESNYQELLALRRAQALSASPRPSWYAIYGNDATTGGPLIQIERPASGTVVLNLDGYVRKTPDMVDKPLPALTAATGATGAITNPTTRYLVTFVTALGESDPGPASTAIALSSNVADLSAIPTSPCHSVTSRKIYRNKAAALTTYYLLDTIADNTTTTYSDNTPDASLGAAISVTTSNAITGMERFPADMSERIFVRGIAFAFSWNQGDARSGLWQNEWEKEIKRFWGEIQPHNEPKVLSAYGTTRGYAPRTLRSRISIS